MQMFRKTVHIILALALLFTGLPLYERADMNRDGKVGLTDAMISVRQLFDQAEADGESFRAGMENTLTSLSVAAGLKQVIQTARDAGCKDGLPALPVLMIACDFQFETEPPVGFPAADQLFLYESPALAPLDPPPSAGLA
jgi:hypothetical protein